MCTVNFKFISLAHTSSNFRLIYLTVHTTSSLGRLTDVSNLTRPKLHSCSFFYISDPIYQPTVSTKSSKYIQIQTISLSISATTILTISLHRFPPGLRRQSPNRSPCFFCLWFPTDYSQTSSQSSTVQVKAGPPSQCTVPSLHRPLWPRFLLLSPPPPLFPPRWPTCQPRFHPVAFALAVHPIR